MTKRDYTIVAAAFRELRPTARDGPASLRRWERVVVQFGKRLAEKNPRFCQVKWMNACGG